MRLLSEVCPEVLSDETTAVVFEDAAAEVFSTGAAPHDATANAIAVTHNMLSSFLIMKCLFMFLIKFSTWRRLLVKVCFRASYIIGARKSGKGLESKKAAPNETASQEKG